MPSAERSKRSTRARCTAKRSTNKARRARGWSRLQGERKVLSNARREQRTEGTARGERMPKANSACPPSIPACGLLEGCERTGDHQFARSPSAQASGTGHTSLGGARSSRSSSESTYESTASERASARTRTRVPAQVRGCGYGQIARTWPPPSIPRSSSGIAPRPRLRRSACETTRCEPFFRSAVRAKTLPHGFS